MIRFVMPVPSMTQYYWNGEGEDPNRDQYLCKECEKEHRDYWASQGV